MVAVLLGLSMLACAMSQIHASKFDLLAGIEDDALRCQLQSKSIRVQGFYFAVAVALLAAGGALLFFV